MRPMRRMGEVVVLRPLLHLSRAALRRVLRMAAVTWIEDPSNLDTGIWRNRIRHQLFPAIHARGIDPVALFLRWGAAAQQVVRALDAAADQAVQGQWQTGDDWVSLPWSVWQQATPALRARILQMWMAALFGEGVTPGRRHIRLVEGWTAAGGRGGLDLSRCRLYRRGSELYLRLQLHAGAAVCGTGGQIGAVSSSVHAGTTD